MKIRAHLGAAKLDDYSGSAGRGQQSSMEIRAQLGTAQLNVEFTAYSKCPEINLVYIQEDSSHVCTSLQEGNVPFKNNENCLKEQVHKTLYTVLPPFEIILFAEVQIALLRVFGEQWGQGPFLRGGFHYNVSVSREFLSQILIHLHLGSGLNI